MGIIGVPMIDRDPVQSGVEVACDVRHQVPGEAAQVVHFSGIFG